VNYGYRGGREGFLAEPDRVIGDFSVLPGMLRALAA
jgi:hypothetical protein